MSSRAASPRGRSPGGRQDPRASRVIRTLYALLLDAYGPQGWWPSAQNAGRSGFDARGYHPGDFSFPRTPAQRLEIVMGAILTQNTAWTNVEKALARLFDAGIRTAGDLRAGSQKRLASLITPSGYYNQKARKLKAMAPLFSDPAVASGRKVPSREALLSLWGVGEETADSILLYAYRKPVFVIDAYARRLLERLGILSGGERYGDVQQLFHAALEARHETYNEFHALIVEHAKRRCRTRPICAGCPVLFCPHRKTEADGADAVGVGIPCHAAGIP
jgi:endonuclease-3 related protein